LTLTPSVVADEPQILILQTPGGHADTNFTDLVDEKVAEMKTEMKVRIKEARHGMCVKAMSSSS
jgi:hypothetical protein